MANPQLEDEGHVKIVNSIMDALARTRIPGEARQVLDYILRQTYGWNEKEREISLAKFSKGTGLSKAHVCRGYRFCWPEKSLQKPLPKLATPLPKLATPLPKLATPLPKLATIF